MENRSMVSGVNSSSSMSGYAATLSPEGVTQQASDAAVATAYGLSAANGQAFNGTGLRLLSRNGDADVRFLTAQIIAGEFVENYKNQRALAETEVRSQISARKRDSYVEIENLRGELSYLSLLTEDLNAQLEVGGSEKIRLVGQKASLQEAIDLLMAQGSDTELAAATIELEDIVSRLDIVNATIGDLEQKVQANGATSAQREALLAEAFADALSLSTSMDGRQRTHGRYPETDAHDVWEELMRTRETAEEKRTLSSDLEEQMRRAAASEEILANRVEAKLWSDWISGASSTLLLPENSTNAATVAALRSFWSPFVDTDRVRLPL